MKHLCLILLILLFSEVNISNNISSIKVEPIPVKVEILDTIKVEIVVKKPSKKLPAHVDKFISENLSIARKTSEKYGIPITMILGIAALESGWGTSKAARVRNNHFGLVGGSKVYKSKKECYKALGRLLSKAKRYKPLQRVTDYKLYCKLLHTTGYNPHSYYPAKLQKVIEYANLQNLE